MDSQSPQPRTWSKLNCAKYYQFKDAARSSTSQMAHHLPLGNSPKSMRITEGKGFPLTKERLGKNSQILLSQDHCRDKLSTGHSKSLWNARPRDILQMKKGPQGDTFRRRLSGLVFCSRTRENNVHLQQKGKSLFRRCVNIKGPCPQNKKIRGRRSGRGSLEKRESISSPETGRGKKDRRNQSI